MNGWVLWGPWHPAQLLSRRGLLVLLILDLITVFAVCDVALIINYWAI